MINGEAQGRDARTVFVVHGRNEPLRAAMFDFLRSIGLRPLEWDQAVALTGSGSPYVGDVLDAAFAQAQAFVVLLTPDEVAYLRSDIAPQDDPETQPALQARPNVLFEAGMALGHDATRTVLVEIGSLRPFSDIVGRHTVRLGNDPKSRKAFVQRLASAGCDVDASGSDWLDKYDFGPPAPPGEGLPLGRRVPSMPAARRPVDFDLKYFNKGGNKIDKLQVVNRGSESVFDVTLELPENAGIEFVDHTSLPIEKIPGGGKSVTIDVFSRLRNFGGGARKSAFDIIVRGRIQDGERVEQDVFVDLNG